MASFRRPNMSKINSAINKMKSANNQFQRDANRAIRELKSLESKVKTEQRKLKSVSRPTVISSRSSVQHVNEIYDFLQENYIEQSTQPREVRDVFISYAHEDRESYVKPLVDE